MTDLPQELIEHLARRDCVLFLGPDISESYAGYRGLPTTWQLAGELAAELAYKGPFLPLPRVAQLYERAWGEQRLVQVLRDRLSGPEYQPLPIHGLLAGFDVPATVYAGWDRLLETALDRQGREYQVVTTAQQVALIDSQKRVLFKPFGTLDRPDSLVITEQRQMSVAQSKVLVGELRHLLARNCLLLIGYAVGYDSVFAQLYHDILEAQGELRPPAFVVQAMDRAEDAAYWESLGIRSIVADPTLFLQELAARSAEAQGVPAPAAGLEPPPAAQRTTMADVQALAGTVNRVMDSLNVGELVEKSEAPLLTAEQVRDLDTMRAAYERLAHGLGDPAEAVGVLLRTGNVEYGRGNYDTAESLYKRALAARPDLAQAQYNLHYVYLAQANLLSDAGEEHAAARLDQALDAYRQAIALDPSLALLPARYTIDAVLGQGGVGVVYRAVDGETGQVVAVKLLNRAHMYSEKAVQRFRREAAILQRLQHPHVVRILHSGQYEDRHYIVLEYLGRESLQRVLRARGRLPLDEAAGLTRQVGEALAAAHAAGIIHRDLKPSNVFIVDGQARVIDFGLAVDMQAGLPSLLGIATGTVRYMSPEQQMGAAVDARTDEYALATVFYEMLTGRHPGEGTYQPASALVPGITAALDIVVERARQTRPDDRYPDVLSFSDDLARVVRTQPASAQAAAWRRVLARAQQVITRLTMDYWYVPIALSLAAAFGLTRLAGSPAGRLAALAVGLLIWDLFLTGVVTQLYVPVLARRSGYGVLAAYGPLLGTVLGLAVAIFAWGSTLSIQEDLTAAGADWTLFVSQYLVHGILAVGGAVLFFAGLTSGLYLARRLRPVPRLAIAFGLAVLITVGLGMVLSVVFGG